MNSNIFIILKIKIKLFFKQKEMKNLLIFTRRSSLLNKLSQAKHKLQENLRASFLNITDYSKKSDPIDKTEDKISINSPSFAMDKQSFKTNKTLNQTIFVNKSNFGLVKAASAGFSSNISIDEIEQKKKSDNNKKANKKIKEDEKLEQQESIKSIKTINPEIEQEKLNKIAQTIQKIESAAAAEKAASAEDKETKSEKINKMIYLKKLNPELKAVIAKKIKKIYPNKTQKSLYPLTQFRELPNENELFPTDPFQNLLDERTSAQSNFNINKNENALVSKIQNENRRIVFNKSLEKANKIAKASNSGENSFKDEFTSNFRNEEFSEYKKTIEAIYLLSKEFSILKFRQVVNYVLENPIEDSLVLRKLEEVFAERLREIDSSSKSELVLVIAKALQKKKIKFNENSWFLILKDFQNLLELNVLTFKDFYNYTIAFEKIKNIIFAARPQFMNDFERFISHDNLTMINSGKIKITNLDEIVLLSSLIHAKIFAINSLSDAVWLSLNEFVFKNALKLNINSLLVLSTLFINFSEVSPKAPVLLNDAIKEISKFINLVFTNFEFLDDHEKMNLINFSDSLFNFYLIFIHSNTHDHSANIYKSADESSSGIKSSSKKFEFILNNDGFLIKNLISIYMQKTKLQNNFNFFHELRILIFLSKELKYFDQEFWDYCAKSLKNFLKIDFLTKISDILPKRIGSGTSSAKARATAVEIEEMSKLFYYGVIIEVFSTVGFCEEEFWDCVFDKFDEIVPISKKDPLILLQFISLHCKKLYRNRKFDKIYERLVNKFSPEFKRIFINREILDFVIGVNFHHVEFNREKNNKLILNLINPLYPFRPLDHKQSENRIIINNEFDKENIININNKNYKKNEEILVESVNLNESISSLEKDDKVSQEELGTPIENKNQNIQEEVKEAFRKEELESLIDNNADENNKEDAAEENIEKEPNNILLLITYLNLLWSKSIFEEEVKIYFLKVLFYFKKLIKINLFNF